MLTNCLLKNKNYYKLKRLKINFIKELSVSIILFYKYVYKNNFKI